MNKPFSVHLASTPEPNVLEHLLSLLSPNVQLSTGDIPDPAEYHILINGRPAPTHLKVSPYLKSLIIPFSGMPPSTKALALENPQLTIHNLHHNAGNVAETTVALLLAAAQFLVPIDRDFRLHDWRPRYLPNPAVLMKGKNALILGYGAIGKKLTPILHALGMTIQGTRQSLTSPEKQGEVEVFPSADLPSLLPQADVLIVAMPLTKETEGMLGKGELKLLPQRAVLVNVGRGKIIEESALYHALKNGTVYAAGLDVWYNYPEDEAAQANTPPSQFPFHELDNVVMSPHRGGAFNVEQTELMRMEALAELINAAADGRPIPNRVNVHRGY